MDERHTWDFDTNRSNTLSRFTHTGCAKGGYGNTGAQPENRSYEKGEEEC